MYRVDNASAVSPIPTPGPVGPNPDSFFGAGSTVLPSDWLNAVQEELSYLIENSPSGPSLSKTDRTQLRTALVDMLNNGTYAALNHNNMVYVREQQASGTAAGSSTGAIQNVRPLNTVIKNGISGVTLSANQIKSVPNGDYFAYYHAPCYSPSLTLSCLHKLRLRDITNNVTLGVGRNALCSQSLNSDIQTEAGGFASFTISGGAVDIELQHWIQAGRAADGLGAAVSSGDIEVYGELIIFKVG